jgi:hypothetical protein
MIRQRLVRLFYSIYTSSISGNLSRVPNKPYLGHEPGPSSGKTYATAFIDPDSSPVNHGKNIITELDQQLSTLCPHIREGEELANLKQVELEEADPSLNVTKESAHKTRGTCR